MIPIERGMWRWSLLAVAIGVAVSAFHLWRGAPLLAGFTGLMCVSLAVIFGLRGWRPDERIREAELRASELALTLSSAIGTSIGLWILAEGGDAIPWFAMTAITIASYTVAQAIAVWRA